MRKTFAESHSHDNAPDRYFRPLAQTSPWFRRMFDPAHQSVGRTDRQDVLPALLHTMAPQIRPVAESLLQPSERAALADVTSSMLAYGLRYAQAAPAPMFSQHSASLAPATNLPLKPAVDRLCAFQVSRFEKV